MTCLNILVKTESFYLESFHSYDVLKYKMYTFF